jgi:neutral ceramidase
MADKELLVGAAMMDITPDRPLPNYNGVMVEVDSNTSPLRCQALAFECGEMQGVVISCDATFVDRTLLAYIRDVVNRATGIPGGHVMVAATHTHSAPAPCPSFLSGALPDPLYIDFFVEQISRAALKAWRERQPARMVSTLCETPGMEFNRRAIRPNGLVVFAGASNSDPSYPTGPVDRVMPFVGFESIAGEPIALMVNYPSHNNAVGRVYSGDIGGRMTEAIQAQLGVDIPALFLEGACADVIWHNAKPDTKRGDERACEIGEAIATIVVSAFKQGERKSIDDVRLLATVMDLPDRKWEDSTFCRDDSRGDSDDARQLQRDRYDPEEAAVIARGDTTCPVEVMGIAFGDTAIVTNPAELFVALGMEIRERSPFAVTLVSELSNGYCGYVGDIDDFAKQGYETHRSVYTCRLAKDGGRRIVEMSVAMLGQLMG